MKLKSVGFFNLVALTLCLVAAPALAQNKISLLESDGFVDAKIGGTLGTGFNLPSLGFAAGYRVLPRFDRVYLGATFFTTPVAKSGNTVTDTHSSYGILIFYNFSEENSGFVAGIKTGLFTRTGFNGFFVEPVVQYHYPLFDMLTVGLEASAPIQLKSGGTAAATAPVLVNGSAVVRYWF